VFPYALAALFLFSFTFQDITEEEKRTECEKKQAQILEYVGYFVLAFLKYL